VEAIKVLAQLGADKDAKTADGATALHFGSTQRARGGDEGVGGAAVNSSWV
jgi:hypothetical protein